MPADQLISSVQGDFGLVWDGDSYEALKNAGLSYEKILQDNDCYHGLQAIDGLVMTGPTGTNVNDFWVALIG